MPRTDFKELLDAGVHFGHLKRKWNPAMAPYIFMERNGIHIIDLERTIEKLDEAASAMKQIAKSGKKILFVATKKQAKEIVAEKVDRVNMPYVTERWPGGMLTNFPTIRKAVKKMSHIDRMATDGTFSNLSKREKLQITRQRAKLEKNLGSIADLTRLPSALFVVDITKEHIAVREARRLGIPVFAMVDTNSDPTGIDFPIPANDDASKSISLITEILCRAVEEGLNERKMEKEKEPGTRERRVIRKDTVTAEGPAAAEEPAEGSATAEKAAPAEEPATAEKAAPAEEPAAAEKATAEKPVAAEEEPATTEKAAPAEESATAEKPAAAAGTAGEGEKKEGGADSDAGNPDSEDTEQEKTDEDQAATAEKED